MIEEYDSEDTISAIQEDITEEQQEVYKGRKIYKIEDKVKNNYIKIIGTNGERTRYKCKKCNEYTWIVV
ncbi:hypothetical protein RCL_jg13988.t1 [Rhizophagus clarus]|uniref:Uncharacterized protein n=1 Tax=Rhizophagus clarus TaxID=94130 RepID=A0A8H3LT46_9GLOM|nr:hypothetical protein RCL_jg13988.t1 [Rhizophagus clarus]